MKEEIGATAGELWHFLDAQGETTWRQIEKRVNRPQRMLAMGIGWLAREDKISIRKRSGVYYVAVR